MATKEVKRRRGTAAQHAGFTGAAGELTVDTTNNRLIVHDGATAGGHAAAKVSELPVITGKVDKSTLSAKGSLIGASAASTPVELAVGANGKVLMAASGETSGMKWDTIPVQDEIEFTALPDDHDYKGRATSLFNAGYSSAIMDLVFMGSGGKWLEVDCDAVATCSGLLAIALEEKTDGQAMKVALPGSLVRDDSWNWTPGATLYAGGTLGAISASVPTGEDGIVKVIGFAVTADVIYFNPSPDQQSRVAA